ncbi:MAG: iron-sulfur cluster assembly scaffold protein [Smithellaceae bacterium]|nr:iron-sulfur cluster assembly scaffold protein [Smithellaceae bacterium]
MQYSHKVMEHLKNPRNMGKMENPDGVGEGGNPVCGDMITITIRVKEDIIDEIRFETRGCGAAIAVSSMVADLAKGKTIAEAMNITGKLVAEELGGLPKNDLHCSNLGVDTLHLAIRDYLDRKEGRIRRRKEEKLEQITANTECCCCPYCDAEFPKDAAICVRCGNHIG